MVPEKDQSIEARIKCCKQVQSNSRIKIHDSVGEVVPWNAKYLYPTQASRAWKTLVKIPPKNGFDFRSGMQNTIRLELPATGYVNPANHSLSFQVKHVLKTRTVGTPLPRFQNNIASIFSRIRCSYGSMTFEDLQNQGILARVLTEGATNNMIGVSAQSSISEGVGGTTQCWDKVGKKVSVTNTRFADIQGGTSKSVEDDSLTAAMVVNRQYTIQLPLGLFQQSKLIPLKWMASQLAIELELADYENRVAQTDNKQLEDYFQLTNVSLNLELLEFDATYDQAMLEGLRGGGVPIKFATYDCFIATPHKSNKQVLTIPERNRSIKAVFNVQVPGKGTNVNQKYPKDSHAFLQSSTGYFNAMEKPWCVGHVVDFQWRIGGKYHPAQPVVCGTDTATNRAADAYWEFAKALNIVGDYRVTTGLNSTRWARGDDKSIFCDWIGEEQKDAMSNKTIDGPSAFVIACNLETSDGTEISGINGEEQNDIALVINYSSEQSPETFYYTFVYYDAMLVLLNYIRDTVFILGKNMAEAVPLRPPIQTVGINDIYVYHELHFDSSQRDNGTNSHPVFMLTNPLNNVLGIKVISADIPYVYYSFNKSNNVFYVEELDLDQTKRTAIRIREGNYSAEEIVRELRYQFLEAGLDLEIEYEARTSTYAVFSKSTEFALVFGLDPEGKEEDLQHTHDSFRLLGFDRGRYPSEEFAPTLQTGPLGAYAYIAYPPYPCFPTSPSYLLLSSDTLGARISRYVHVSGKAMQNAGVLAKIPVNALPFDMIHYEDPTPIYVFDTSAGNVQAVDLQLKYGDTGMEVDLNGIAWCVTLGVLVKREASLARYDFVNNRNKRTLPVTMSMGPGSSAKRFKVM
ncbi:hypothetical protein BC832DRAFT_536600 [Gaertneriomyces semiglobifer]|nr:hypothetical protein BC832DRAFT_536600 [Gaertneriomyces semiglobifer]